MTMRVVERAAAAPKLLAGTLITRRAVMPDGAGRPSI